MSQIDLSKYDYCIVVDRSGSMSTQDCPGKRSRWEQAKEWGKQIAQKCEQYDDDGIDVIFFDDSLIEFNEVKSDKVDEMFRKYGPSGSTDTAKAIDKALNLYFSKKKSKKGMFSMFSKGNDNVVKPLIIVCITDGEPNDERKLEDVIINATKKIESDSEIGITFIQVGANKSARAFLKRLDDGLVKRGAKFDIVDCKDYEEMSNTSIEDVFIGALID